MSGKHSMPNDEDMPKAFQKENSQGPNTNTKKKKKKTGLKTFGKVVLVLVIILVAILASIFFYVNDKLGKMQQIELNEAELGIADAVGKNLSGYRNIAIFGIDSREDDYGKGNRSDCIIIASINNKTKEVKLISVYRDTYLQIEGHGLDKVTHAYSYGEAQLAVNTLNTNLDLNIKEFVTVNFDSVAEAVDALGGITMRIEESEVKYINDYIVATAKNTGKEAHYIKQAGTQTLDGVQAVAYSRIRYTTGGDYKRTERMRDVIEAMVNKLKTKSIGEINTFADRILPKVYTNISTGDVLGLLPDIASFKITDSIGWPYETKGITLDRWYGVPINLANNVTKLHKEAFGENDYTPSSTVQEISNKIIKKTGYQ